MNKRLVIILSAAIAVLAVVVIVLVVQIAMPSAADQEREAKIQQMCQESTGGLTFDECVENLRSRP